MKWIDGWCSVGRVLGVPTSSAFAQLDFKKLPPGFEKLVKHSDIPLFSSTQKGPERSCSTSFNMYYVTQEAHRNGVNVYICR